jgi:hypothetical protein
MGKIYNEIKVVYSDTTRNWIIAHIIGIEQRKRIIYTNHNIKFGLWYCELGNSLAVQSKMGSLYQKCLVLSWNAVLDITNGHPTSSHQPSLRS